MIFEYEVLTVRYSRYSGISSRWALRSGPPTGTLSHEALRLALHDLVSWGRQNWNDEAIPGMRSDLRTPRV